MSSSAFIFNTKDEYTAKQLSERYRDHLPMLVAVSKGFYGNREEMTFSTGQILRLHELRQQQRALVHDDKQKTLSVPLDYKHLFFVGGDQSQSFTLRQIAEKYSLPAQVRFADPHVHFDSDNDHSRNLHSLTIIKVHNESYFLANTIANGEPLPEVIPIPLYLKQVTFCPVIGVKGEGVSGGGQTLMDRLLRPQSMARVNFNQDHSDKEMVQLSDRPLKATDNIYANIDTNIYINARTRGGGARRLPPPPPPAEEPLHDQPSVFGAAPIESEYQNYNTVGRKGMKTPEGSSPVLPPRPENLAPLSRGPSSPGASKGSQGEAGDSRPESSSSQEYQDIYEPAAHSDSESGSDVYEPVGDLQLNKPKPEKKSTKKTKSRPSESKPSPDPTIPFTSELQQKLKIRKHDSKSSGKATTPVKDPPKTTFNTADNSEPKANTLPFKVKLRPVNARNTPQPSTPAKEETPPLKPSQLARNVNIASSSAANDEPKEWPKPTSTPKPAPPTKPLKPAATKPSGGKSPSLTAGVKTKQESPKPEPKPLVTPSKPVGTAPTKPQISQGITTNPQRSTTSQHSATKPPASWPSSAIHPTPNSADYTNQKEMAIVGPTVQKTPPSSDEVKHPPSKQPSTPQPKLQKQASESKEELKPLAEMSIPDVQALLSRLNLEDYREKFEKKQIDGVLLSMLSEEALKEDFNMSSIDRIKLMAFVQKGHLPRYEDWPL